MEVPEALQEVMLEQPLVDVLDREPDPLEVERDAARYEDQLRQEERPDQQRNRARMLAAESVSDQRIFCRSAAASESTAPSSGRKRTGTSRPPPITRLAIVRFDEFIRLLETSF